MNRLTKQKSIQIAKIYPYIYNNFRVLNHMFKRGLFFCITITYLPDYTI